tara:strand:- start:2408 stop:2620 length:213 start_codon:yes stop_codon:yes gene_type:complete
MNDNNTELLQALSNININSETAVEVVEVYCQYLFYIELYTGIIETFAILSTIGIIAFFGWFVIKVIKEVD